MSESERQVITTAYTGKPKSAPEHKADMEALAAQQLDGVLLRAFPPKAIKAPETRGRKQTEEMRALRSALHICERNMPPEGGTLEEWCDRLKDKAKYATPATTTQLSRRIEYLDALNYQDYREKIRLRFRKILGGKLLPRR